MSSFPEAVRLLLQVLDKNTVKLVGQEFGLLVVDKAKEEVTDAAKKKNEFMDEADFDEAVSVTVQKFLTHKFVAHDGEW